MQEAGELGHPCHEIGSNQIKYPALKAKTPGFHVTTPNIPSPTPFSVPHLAFSSKLFRLEAPLGQGHIPFLLVYLYNTLWSPVPSTTWHNTSPTVGLLYTVHTYSGMQCQHYRRGRGLPIWRGRDNVLVQPSN